MMNEILDKPVWHLELSVSLLNFVNNKGFSTIGELVSAEPGTFVVNGRKQEIRERFVRQINEALSDYGLKLRE